VGAIANPTSDHRGLEEVYTQGDLARMESKCSRLILDCVDWSHDDIEAISVGNLYDLLYQVYCAKLTPDGQPESQERQLR
jgi:hypothetical protein